LVVDLSGLHSVHPLVREKPGRMPFRDIKAMKDDPAAVEAQSDEIKARYTKYFKV
jgi:iron(III) transport system substrate-binding protein